MIYGVIIAGGRGERFWPRSIRSMPKQLLPLISNRPMIVETVERIAPLIPNDRVIIVAGQEHENCLKQILPPNIKLLLEPFGRNTTCAIAYSAIQLKEVRPQADDIMVVLPADHHIPDKELFLTTLDKAISVAQKGWLVTFGIVPTRAEMGYGYIEVGDSIADDVYKVKSFKEKPNQKQAQRFLREDKFLWNSGIFVWTRNKILSEIQSYMPDFYKELSKFEANQLTMLDLYNKAPNISIDYAVLEKSHNVAVIKSDFLWDDVGSWNALERVHKADDHGNIKVGLHKGMSTDNCIIVSDSGVIATIGIANLIIVHSGEAVFVCDKHHIGEIKELIRRMSEDETLSTYL